MSAGEVAGEAMGLDFSHEQLTTLCRILVRETGFTSCEAYKQSCLQRRIVARMHRAGCCMPDQYLELLRQDGAEAQRLARALTIHVSHFFRNPGMFDLLQRELLPGLIQNSVSEGRHLRIWSIGCAGGEEPYSLAILLAESFPELISTGSMELLATDIDESSLQKAQAGFFDASALKEVSEQRLRRWFAKEQERYRVRPELTRLVSFRRMDLTQTDLYQPCQLVLCRNTMIYFNRQAQELVLQAIADILPSGGILVLGKSEALPATVRHLYRAVSIEERVYRRI